MYSIITSVLVFKYVLNIFDIKKKNMQFLKIHLLSSFNETFQRY